MRLNNMALGLAMPFIFALSLLASPVFANTNAAPDAAPDSNGCILVVQALHQGGDVEITIPSAAFGGNSTVVATVRVYDEDTNQIHTEAVTVTDGQNSYITIQVGQTGENGTVGTTTPHDFSDTKNVVFN